MSEDFVWIPLSDGLRLAATLYLPDGGGRSPAVLEALPYRKDDVTAYDTPEYRRLRDEGGFGVCRVDLRGTGSSEGFAADEYPPQEQKDLCEVIAWLAAQEWCTGRVGMYGTSYSGFNSIQVAMERPPALEAIVPIFATDDRYSDDVHYYGGIRRGGDLTDYPLYMVAMNALPPTPKITEQWREAWRERVEGLEPWLVRWLGEQTDGPYWRHGSLRPNYDRIVCPTMIVAGWADGYRNATFRMFERLECPKRLVFGPWSHTSTETSRPGPRIDLLPEIIRWFDHWLRAAPNGTPEEPPILVFVRRSTAPDGNLDSYRGEFRFEPGWPPGRAEVVERPLSEARGPSFPELRVRPDVGVAAPHWCSSSTPYTQPFDQRADEAYSLSYEWPASTGELEIMGYPRVELAVAATAPVAQVVAKLCDVFPDGASALVARGALNLTHRRSHADPEPLEPGRTYAVSFELDATSWIFEPGHGLRLDVAGTDWPNLWPPPTPVVLSVDPSRSSLSLPVLRGASPIRSTPALPPPRPHPARAPHDAGADQPPVLWRLEEDVVAAERRLVTDHGAEADLEIGGHLSERYVATVGVSTTDPGRAYNRAAATFKLQWPEVTVAAESRALLHSDADNFYLELQLDTSEDGDPRWSRRWERTYPRRLA
jgi:putative CocE/NonD family hydrolase